MRRVLQIIVALLVGGQAAWASAAYSSCGTYLTQGPRNATIVLFVNGIKNQSTDACKSSGDLGKLLDSTYDLSFQYNNTDGFLDDTEELRTQAQLSDDAISQAGLSGTAMTENERATYYDKLGYLYEGIRNSSDPTRQRIYSMSWTLKTRLESLASRYQRVIIVAHSQGNFVVEAAYALLVRSGNTVALDKLRFVGVASVAATTPSSTYISHADDWPVFWAQTANAALIHLSLYHPLSATDHAEKPLPSTAKETSGYHNFVKVYLSDSYRSVEQNKSFREIVKGYIQGFYLAPSSSGGSSSSGGGSGSSGGGSTPPAIPTRMLNDTGIQFCGSYPSGNSTCDGTQPAGQDAQYGRDALATAGPLNKIGSGDAGFDFTALDAGGNPTTPSTGASPHPCVRDNVTGLVWEVKTDDGGLRDRDWTYSWYNSNSPDSSPGTTNGGACYEGGRCDTEKYVDDSNVAGLCGYHDWRMPTIKELEGISDLGRFWPAIDTAFFPNMPGEWAAYYWTATRVSGWISYPAAWAVSAPMGTGAGYYRTNAFHIRLVRGTQ